MKLIGNALNATHGGNKPRLNHAPLKETRGRLRPMPRVMKNAVVGKGIPTEEQPVCTPSPAADNPRKTLSALATWTARETFRR
jgi:hypothetical protein